MYQGFNCIHTTLELRLLNYRCSLIAYCCYWACVGWKLIYQGFNCIHTACELRYLKHWCWFFTLT